MKYQFYKSLLDFTLAILLLPLAIPLIILFAAVIFITMRQNPFFIQDRRLTFTKCRLKVYKLRTIRSDADDLLHMNNCKDPFLKGELNIYVPKFAAWLRKTGLDELPQLINILKGEMSFVGPRPLTIGDLQYLKKYDRSSYKKRNKLLAKPGLTGLWQIYCDRESGAKNLIMLDAEYDQNCTFSLDVELLLKTVYILMTANKSDSIIFQETASHQAVPIQSVVKMDSVRNSQAKINSTQVI